MTDQQNPAPDDAMHKQETVKDDGRQLIYYTFGSQETDAAAPEETPHV